MILEFVKASNTPPEGRCPSSTNIYQIKNRMENLPIFFCIRLYKRCEIKRKFLFFEALFFTIEIFLNTYISILSGVKEKEAWRNCLDK